MPVIKELDARGWRNKGWTTRKHRECGGRPFNKASLCYLLKNVLYNGKLTYGKEINEGEQPAIVDVEVFEQVQALLHRNGTSGGNHVRNRFGALLMGLLRCVPCGCAMVHTHTKKGNKRYRYYVCLNAQKRGWHNCPSKSVPAGEMERFVIEQIRSVGKNRALQAETFRQARTLGEKRTRELEAEKAALEGELRRHAEELHKLVSQGERQDAIDRMADLQERIRTAEQRATQVREELIALGRGLVDEREVAQALEIFDPVWESMSPREQARAIQLLVDRVDYDGARGTVSVVFHPAGMKLLANDSKNREVRA
jgi:site-specific DNA recombinase